MSTLAELDKYAYSGHSVLMGRKKRPWQNMDYVLSYFGDTPRRARKDYYSYVEAGLDQGRRKELTGGGLIRSLGGWAEVRKHGLKGQEHIKSDERILGGSYFVTDILYQANEKFDRKYELKRLGYDLDRVLARVAEIYGIEVDDIFLIGNYSFSLDTQLPLSYTRSIKKRALVNSLNSIINMLKEDSAAFTNQSVFTCPALKKVGVHRFRVHRSPRAVGPLGRRQGYLSFVDLARKPAST